MTSSARTWPGGAPSGCARRTGSARWRGPSKDMHHSVAIALAAIWPLNFWRIDPMGLAD